MKIRSEEVRLEQRDEMFIKEALYRTKEERDSGEGPKVPILETIRPYEWTNKDFTIFTDDDFKWLIPEGEQRPNPYWAEAGVKHPEAKKDQSRDLLVMDLSFSIDLPGIGFTRCVGLTSEFHATEVLERLDEGTKVYDTLVEGMRRYVEKMPLEIKEKRLKGQDIEKYKVDVIKRQYGNLLREDE